MGKFVKFNDWFPTKTSVLCIKHLKIIKATVSKNDLFTDSDNMNIHTSFNKFILFFKLYFPKGHLHIMYFVFHILLYAY